MTKAYDNFVNECGEGYTSTKEGQEPLWSQLDNAERSLASRDRAIESEASSRAPEWQQEYRDESRASKSYVAIVDSIADLKMRIAAGEQ